MGVPKQKHFVQSSGRQHISNMINQVIEFTEWPCYVATLNQMSAVACERGSERRSAFFIFNQIKRRSCRPAPGHRGHLHYKWERRCCVRVAIKKTRLMHLPPRCVCVCRGVRRRESFNCVFLSDYTTVVFADAPGGDLHSTECVFLFIQTLWCPHDWVNGRFNILRVTSVSVLFTERNFLPRFHFHQESKGRWTSWVIPTGRTRITMTRLSNVNL